MPAMASITRLQTLLTPAACRPMFRLTITGHLITLPLMEQLLMVRPSILPRMDMLTLMSPLAVHYVLTRLPMPRIQMQKHPTVNNGTRALSSRFPFSTVLRSSPMLEPRAFHLDHLRDINAGQLGVAGATTVSTARPYPFFSQINDLETRQVSNYDSLQVTAERRAHGLNFLASYTYSHALDESTASPGAVVNPYDIRADYGNSDEDIPNRFVGSATYELPFKGTGLLGGFVNGWQLNTILQYYDGFPFSVTASSGVGDGLTPRAQVSGIGSLPSNQRNLGEWFNTTVFANPTAGTWGDSGRNILQGPGTKNIDFSLFKNTHLSEAKVLQLRAEFFNLFNTPQFNNPAGHRWNNDIWSSLFSGHRTAVPAS